MVHDNVLGTHEANVHTVLVTGCGRGGLAVGVDAEGAPFRIWLQTPRAVERAKDQLAAFARSIGTGYTPIPRTGWTHGWRYPQLVRGSGREWCLR